ncbi:MAG: LPS O-antigen subunit length determinant protein (WzzB/FepE family) [Oleispira sp.]
MLKKALVKIEKDLNEIQQNIGHFVDAIRELTVESHTQVYIANSAPQVRGGVMQLAPRFALFVVLGSLLGLFLGVFVALMRSALLKSKS